MAKTPSKKSAKAPKKAGGEKRKKKAKQTYSSYIYKVLKQVHPDTGISSKGMAVMCNFITDLFERIGNEATCCSVFTCSHRSSLSRRGGVEKHQGVVHDWRKEASRGLKRSEQCQTTACQGTEGALRTT